MFISKSIIALDENSESKYYRDHLCAFRCLAVHQGHHKVRLESEVLFEGTELEVFVS